jgi:acetyltransferase-like isoleucine patch superfamily enzyme
MANVVGTLRRLDFVHVYGMQIGRGTKISTSARLDKTNPRGISIGSNTRIAFGAAILTHDGVRVEHASTRIGDDCLIGAHAIVLPGVTIGDHCIVAAGSVVIRDVPARSVVAGNPAVVIESGIDTRRWGTRASSDSRRVVPSEPLTAEDQT